MPKIPFKDRTEWLRGRLAGIGASEIAGVLRPYLPEADRDPFLSPYRIWCEKTGTLPAKDLSGIESVEWGLRHEPTIAQAVMDRTGRRVILSEEFTLYQAADNPILQASPDAFQQSQDRDDPGVLQIKTSMFFKRDEWIDKETQALRAPMFHQIQVQAEMRVTGCKWGSLVVLIGGNRLLGPIDYERNDGFLANAEPLLMQFWDLVQRGIEPPIDDSEATGDVLNALYRNPVAGKSAELPEDLIPVVDEWRKVNAEKRAAEKREKQLKTLLAGAMKDATVGRLPDGRKLLYPVIERSGYTVEAGQYRKFSLG